MEEKATMTTKLFSKNRYIHWIILLSLLPLISIFATDKLLHTHDGLVHLPRLAAYFKALRDGQIPPRFAGDLNYGYGMPLFIFIYHFPYLLGSGLLAIGFSLVNAFKLTLAASYLFSGLFMYWFSREFFRGEQKALLVTIFYQFAPFRLVEILTRGSFGEVYTYTFLPLVLYGIVQRNLILTAVATMLLVISHNSISLVFFGVTILFIFFFNKGLRQIFWSLLALGIGLGLSAFYWLPAIAEHKYTYGDMFMKDVYLDHFPPLHKLLLPHLTNSQFFQIEGISVQIGLFHIIAILLSLWFIFRTKLAARQRKLFIFCYFLIGISLFFMQPLSGIFWERISLLRQFQFPWRFLSLVTFATSLLAVGYLQILRFKNKALLLTLILLTAVFTIAYWRPVLGYDKIEEDYYWNFPLNTTYYGETDVIWSAGPASDYPPAPVEVAAGDAIIKDYQKKSNLHIYTVEVTEQSTIVDHTQYFPGWKVYVDDKKAPIEFQDQNWRGEITFAVPEGKHSVRVVFGESKIRLLADLVSLGALGILGGFGLFKLLKKSDK